MKLDLKELGITTNFAAPVNYGVTLSNHSVMPDDVVPLIQVHLPSSASEYLALDAKTADWVVHALRKLESLGALHQGWDSYDGLPMSAGARETTFDAIEWLKTQDLPIPAVVLGSEGTVHLEWRTKGRGLNVSLGEGEFVEYAKIDNQGQIQEGEEHAEIRNRLLTLTHWLKRG